MDERQIQTSEDRAKDFIAEALKPVEEARLALAKENLKLRAYIKELKALLRECYTYSGTGHFNEAMTTRIEAALAEGEDK